MKLPTPKFYVEFNEYRPCHVSGIGEALFHRWEDYSEPIGAGVTIGSHPAGVLSFVRGIVEDMSGKIHYVTPSDVTFLDNKATQIFSENDTKEVEE